MKIIFSTILILIIGMQSLQALTYEERQARFLTKKHLENLTIDYGVISCWKRGASKYVIIDYNGEIYAVNGKARSHARKAGWKQAESLFKKGGNFIVFSDIVQVGIKNGCKEYYGL